VWVRLPSGSADRVAPRLAALPRRQRITHVVHTIARGETLGQIARLYHVSVDDITSANRGLKPRSLRIGHELTIPTSGVPSASRAARAAAARAATRTPTPARSPAVALVPSAGPQGTTRRTTHIVRSGETLWTIAQQFDVALDDLLRANRLTRRSVIHPGDALRIPD
jgi:LysM repeat protein